VCTPTGGILYHITRKAQRGTSTERQLLCDLPDWAHHYIAKLAKCFESARTKFSPRRLPHKRWPIGPREPTTQGTMETLTSKPHLVLHGVHEHMPDGFAWTSHSSRKGAATTSYCVGTPIQKIKFFGGWARESDVVLDYIDRPYKTREPGSLASIWLDDPWRSLAHRHTPVCSDMWHR
jgi:hypothetical protein